MAVVRMDNVAVVVEDLEGAVAFFTELGLEKDGDGGEVGGAWVDRILDLEGVRSEIVMMQVPGGGTRLELTRYRSPAAVGGGALPVNSLGIGRIMFAVDDIDDTVARLTAIGGSLVGEIVQYENYYRLCYLRGPEGIVLGIAQQLS